MAFLRFAQVARSSARARRPTAFCSRRSGMRRMTPKKTHTSIAHSISYEAFRWRRKSGRAQQSRSAVLEEARRGQDSISSSRATSERAKGTPKAKRKDQVDSLSFSQSYLLYASKGTS